MIARFRDAQANDFEDVCRLLREAGLPTQDLRDDGLEHFVVCDIGDAVVGVIGLEVHGRLALARSLVVAEEHRSQRIASRLLSRIEKHARTLGVETVFALTTTAQQWLEGQGFAVIDRQRAPATIQASSQYRELCPDSAILLWKSVTHDGQSLD